MATGNPKAAEEIDALVLFDPFSTHGSFVAPHTLKAVLGKTVSWLIEAPADHPVSFSFVDFPDDPTRGPFSFFSIEPVSGSTLLATGTSLEGVAGQLIHYNVTVRDPEGRVLGVDDPVIEPLDPPDGPPRASLA